MNRYPFWKYCLIGLVLAAGVIYSLPNLFGETPAVLVSSAKPTVKVTPETQKRADEAVKAAGVVANAAVADNNQFRLRFKSTEEQFKARTAIENALNPNKEDPSYVVAFGLLSSSPQWLTSLHALPMYLGLDLRGGVHFLMQVDLRAATNKRFDALVSDIRSNLREKSIRQSSLSRSGDVIEIKFADEAARNSARGLITDNIPDLALEPTKIGEEFVLLARFKPEAIRTVQDAALKQNISTINNRVNELGVAEPVVQQQGTDRIVIQLPGVQDPALAKKVLGRTATLELRMVCESPDDLSSLRAGTTPFGCERFNERSGEPLAVKKQVVITGDNLSGAQANFDSQNQEPIVNLEVDAKGARIMRDISRENIGKRMAILLIEKGKGEVITAPVIRGELGNRFQISGRMNPAEAAETALLLRAGALAAPMEIIEERTIGPSLGAENIQKGFNSVLYGFCAIAVFMCVYYALFGAFSTLALALNLLLLVSLLSMFQATLTLPGFAAIALTLGMAIDANVLINERIREELRMGKTAQVAIKEGYERAWATILDSNVTTLIAGVALIAFGSGAIKGFAIVHCLGILTSMFSAVFVSRAIVNLWYGSTKNLEKLSIGTVWKPGSELKA
jgi:preprotein translocase subunit SecD